MYSIGEASRLSGVHAETIRYYEREGILPAPPRSASGRRLYGSGDLSGLRFVKICRELGFAMSDIKALLHLASVGSMKCGEARPIAEARLEEIARKMDELARMRDALKQLIDQCGDPDSQCPMLRVFFQ